MPSSGGQTEVVTTNGSIVIVGANGSGKTRLGAWIEFTSPQRDRVHRISAQKSLNMPDSTSPIQMEKAEAALLYGYQDSAEANRISHKLGNRWGSHPATSLLNDFDRLMVFLFSDHYEKSTEYLRQSRETTVRVDPPVTKLDRIVAIWHKILPHRELAIGGGHIKTKTSGDAEQVYNASEMSDGERVVFYLIGQCLAAPENGIIIIDEPELHLHKSIQTNLWHQVEQTRPDCLFVYLTHDIDFAASHQHATKIWVKGFSGSTWQWESIEPIEGIPDGLMLGILGSRRSVVFVEGENGSKDVALYRALYPQLLVVPRGSCTQVVDATKALRGLPQFHYLNVSGIVDRDRRADEEITALAKHRVVVLEVAEVENLFCVPEILNLVASRLELNPGSMIDGARELVIQSLQDELDVQISLRTANEIRFRLSKFDQRSVGLTDLQQELQTLVGQIDVRSIYEDNKRLLTDIIDQRDYLAALKYYNRKNLSSRISEVLGMKQGQLSDYVLRLANGDSRDSVARALRPYVPNIGTE